MSGITFLIDEGDQVVAPVTANVILLGRNECAKRGQRRHSFSEYRFKLGIASKWGSVVYTHAEDADAIGIEQRINGSHFR